MVVLCLMPMLAIAKPSYPPYPDIWGYDLMEDFNQDSIGLAAYYMNNGDYILHYPSTKTDDSDEMDYTLLSFFERKKRVFKRIEDAMRYFDVLGFKPGPRIRPYIVLSDGKIIDINNKPKVFIKYKRMFSLHDTYIRRLDDFGVDKPNDYEVSPIGIATHCDDKQVCNNWAYSLARRIIKLKDDTFFIFDPHHYLFLRFDRDFKTKFKPQHTVDLGEGRKLKNNFYILPYAKIEHFFDNVAIGYVGEYNEDINNQFLDYLFEEEQKGNI